MKTSKLCFKNIKDSFYILRRRLFFVVGALIIFRIGSFIPIPGIDINVFTKILEQQQGTIIEMFNMFSGGALSRASVFSLGIMPYISSSIIVQLLSSVHPKLIELKKEGEAGRRKINSFIRYGTLFLGIFQAIGIATGLPSMSGVHGLIVNPCISFYFIAVTSLVCGTIFLMWLGEQITHRGIGNGISIIIFSGIVAELPVAVLHTIEHARQGELHFFVLIVVSILILLITFFVVFIERGQRRIIVHYAKKQHGRKIYTPQSTHLPLKVNMAGVIPAIFASSVILFPGTITSWFGGGIGWSKCLTVISFYLQPGQPLYIILYAVAIIFFCFFYTSLVFNSRETSDNLKKSGAFLPGIRPGEQTARYIDRVMTRLTLFGAVYITFICLVPEFLRITMHVPFYFGGTSLLIVVIVIMDFIVQIQTLLMSTQYESVLKKTSLKGF